MSTTAARLSTTTRTRLHGVVTFILRGLPTFVLLLVLVAGRRPAAPIAFSHAPRAAMPAAPSYQDSVDATARLSATALRRPLEDVFAKYSSDRVMVRRIARAVVRYAQRRDLDVSLVAAVVITENRTLLPRATSNVGAQGLMQVMPFHAGIKGCPSADLTDVENNICHGTAILADKLREAPSSRHALLRYNGCVKGTNTPTCHTYPDDVLARAGQVRAVVLAHTRGLEPLPVVVLASAR